MRWIMLLLAFAAMAQEPVAVLHGTLKSVAGKKLVVEVEEGNTMEFYTGRKTEFRDGKKKIKLADLKPGDVLTIESRAALGGTFDAVKVTVERLKQRED